MNERREMAEIYGRGEIDLVNVGIRGRGYVCNDIGVMRGNGDGFRSVGRSYDHGLLVRDNGVSSRFQFDSLLDDSRGVLRANSIREDEQRGGFVSRGENYDGLVERSSRSVDNYNRNDVELRGSRDSGMIEDTRGGGFASRVQNCDELVESSVRNVGSYDRNDVDFRGDSRSNVVREDGDHSGFASRGQNYDGIVEISLPPNDVDFRGGSRANEVRGDTQISGFANASRRQNYDGVTEASLPFLRARTRNVNGLPNEGGRNYSVRQGDSPPFVERELAGQLYDGENGPRRTPFHGIASEGNYSIRERELLRSPYDEENGLNYRPEDGSHSLTPRSHSSGRRTPFQDVAMEGLPQEVQYRSVDNVGSGSRIPSSSYHHIFHSNAGGTSHRFSVEAVSPRGEYAASVRRSDDIHPENQRSRIFYRETVPESNYGNNQEGTFEIDAASATLPRRNHAGYVHRDVVVEDEYSGRRNISHPLQVAPTLENSGGSRIAYEMVYDEANIDFTNSYLSHRTQDILGSLPREEQISYGQDDLGRMVYFNSPRRNNVPLTDGNTWQMSETRDFALPEQPNTTRKRLHEFVDEMHDSKRIIVSTRDVSSYDNRHRRAEGDRELGFSNRITHRHDEPHSRVHVGMINIESSQPFSGLHSPHELCLGDPQESDRDDVKKRLTFPKAVSRASASQLPWKQEAKSRVKPSPRKTHAKSSVKNSGKGKDTDSKKKLNSVPEPAFCTSDAPDSVVLDSGVNGKKKQKLAIPDSGNMNVALRPQDIDKGYQVLKVKPLVDLPEDSEKFKQQVYKSFTECIWHLYRNIGLKERFMGKGTGGCLKCFICSSHTEFAETKDVAMHAFSSLKVGYRAHHLGFHQALCVLMGWDSVVAPNCRWVRQPLPELTVWTLKEDVIIWPPVVIVHNNPPKNCQFNEAGKQTIELQNFLTDNGFIREIRSINGNPGNLNIMVVKFNGTLSGYKEAERLHNFFAESEHGRVELAQIDASEVVCCKLLVKKPKDELEPVDKRDDDQEPVDKTKDELMTVDHLIDERKDVDEPLDKAKVDQQLVDMTQDDEKPVITAQNDPELIEAAPDKQNSVVTVQGDQKLIETAQDDQKPVVPPQDDQKPVVMARDDQEPVNKIEDDSLPVNKASDDQPLPHKIKRYQEPVDRTIRTLYGYLGIIEDLTILRQDITITRHHRARSKKEIRAFL